ncbi:TPA: HEPN domain-containing protein [Candidatus Woesearchaeota archaeon]|nr:HEPN domain-containing protein [Candidatus Woesearchaeota archaeon]
MIDEKRKKEAQSNFSRYLQEGLLKKEHNDLAMNKYIENADISLKTANELMQSQLKPYLWVIVTSYYSMFYMANAVLLSYGYKTQDKIAHKVTSDALIFLILDKLRKELLEGYEAIQRDTLEIASTKAESVIESYSLELDKRSRFQYNMLEQTKEAKAQTSLKLASEFVFELKKLLKGK